MGNSILNFRWLHNISSLLKNLKYLQITKHTNVNQSYVLYTNIHTHSTVHTYYTYYMTHPNVHIIIIIIIIRILLPTV